MLTDEQRVQEERAWTPPRTVRRCAWDRVGSL